MGGDGEKKVGTYFQHYTPHYLKNAQAQAHALFLWVKDIQLRITCLSGYDEL